MNFLTSIFNRLFSQPRVQAPTLPSDRTRDFLRSRTRLYEIIQDADDVLTNTEKVNALIMGSVQSGKSRTIHALALYQITKIKKSVVILVRNCCADLEQMEIGLVKFIEELTNYTDENALGDEEIIFNISDIVESRNKNLRGHEVLMAKLLNEKPVIILCMANPQCVRKLNFCLNDANSKVLTIVDECDQTLYSGGQHLPNHIDELWSSNTTKLFGVSATMFEPFSGTYSAFNTKNCYVLPPPSNYKGIDNITFKYIKGIDEKNKKNKTHLEYDTDLVNFINTIATQAPFENHPIQALLKTERLVLKQQEIMKSILGNQLWAEKLAVVVYNGVSIILYHESFVGEKIRLPINRKLEKKQIDPKLHYWDDVSIQSVLQFLKDREIGRTIIISDRMANRGINFVSSDFEWHLTHMFYRPSDSSKVGDMLQSIRLCGLYDDDIPLTCYLEPQNHEDLKKGDLLQKDMFQRIKKTHNKLNLCEWLDTVEFYFKKIPAHRKLCRTKINIRKTTDKSRDDGFEWGEDTEEELSFSNLTGKDGLFSKWSNPNEKSIIAIFMRDGLDPRKRYTNEEFLALCHKFKILKHFNAKGYKGLLVKDRDTNQFYLQPNLVSAYEKFFRRP